MIFSPVNDGPDRIMVLERDIRTRSLFDPQFYVPASERGKLPEFPFFPSAVMPALTTTDFETVCWGIARQCVEWQVQAGFSHVGDSN